MPRRRRYIEPGRVYHIISRFVDREWFVRVQEERAFYLALLGRALVQSDWMCLAYAIMSNHIHLALVAGQQSLASWVRRVHSPFAQWMNHKYERIGPLFVRGPNDHLITDERTGNLIAYIHNNPVRAGVVGAASQSCWTSHRAYLGLERAPGWLHVENGLVRSGFDDSRVFDQWVAEPSAHAYIRDLMPAPVAPVVRNAQPVAQRIDPQRILDATASEVGLAIAQLCSRRRGTSESIGRQVAVRCADALGLAGCEIAVALALSPQRVSAIRRAQPSGEVMERASRVLMRLDHGAANDQVDRSDQARSAA